MGSRVRVRVSDFAASVRRARAGDLVFFDPPYVTGHNNNGFVDYNEDLFSWADQVRLAKVARDLAGRGVNVIVTNANHEAVLDLYPAFRLSTTTRMSTLANDKAFRRPVTEALIYSHPQESK
jgi:DNA adenine methylase